MVRRLSNDVLRGLTGSFWGTTWVYAVNKLYFFRPKLQVIYISCSGIYDGCVWEIGLWNQIILHFRFLNYIQHNKWIWQFFLLKILFPANWKRWKLVSPYELLLFSSSFLLKYDARLQRTWANWPNLQFSVLYFSIIL